MSKKEKTVLALVEDVQALIALVPKLEALVKVHKEISAGYQKYRKNGGAEIAGIEKHLGVKEQSATPSLKEAKIKTKTDTKEIEEGTETKKSKKKVKK